ncbi:hypothetical protein [Bosea sp. BIWAKO-01]|uniref:hypothetical protein n=1 Tax=Bosea sp. BIWAKO-01 TaxID=506668 RepID=UPI00086E9D46|nr:hypothetical protein [Bosea sp. BIWAKO-01]GAU86968.1 hypothetical protein BIWAKO_06916 [Bosea sp. BIWAKO-01]
MDERTASIREVVDAEAYTHIQIVCCEAVLKPVHDLPEWAREKSLVKLAGSFRCSRCGKLASPGRVAFWKHGRKRLAV